MKGGYEKKFPDVEDIDDKSIYPGVNVTLVMEPGKKPYVKRSEDRNPIAKALRKMLWENEKDE